MAHQWPHPRDLIPAAARSPWCCRQVSVPLPPRPAVISGAAGVIRWRPWPAHGDQVHGQSKPDLAGAARGGVPAAARMTPSEPAAYYNPGHWAGCR